MVVIKLEIGLKISYPNDSGIAFTIIWNSVHNQMLPVTFLIAATVKPVPITFITKPKKLCPY